MLLFAATGFDTPYNLKYPVYVNGVDTNEKWRFRDKAPSYLSVGYAEVRLGQTQISNSANRKNRFPTTLSMAEHTAQALTDRSSPSFRRIPITRCRLLVKMQVEKKNPICAPPGRCPQNTSYGTQTLFSATDSLDKPMLVVVQRRQTWGQPGKPAR
jgi:hypothetical protein